MSEPGVQSMSYRYEAARAGVTFGSVLAIVISWSVHHSIVWAIIQGFFSWLYVIYYAITR
ncbi:MAG TPA: hypothetical protein VGQ30_07175 [Gemmatimonadaceae bacterium]|jgi:hypothetical protein|nr:hypothetical protein [Gemmatimonadaceae bacterium]